MSNIVLSWKLGIDQLSQKATLPDGAVKDAVNVDIDRSGGVDRRDGYTLMHAYDSIHSPWTSLVRGDSFAVVENVLCKINVTAGTFIATGLGYTFANNNPVSYEDLNGSVVCGNRDVTLVIAPSNSVRRLGLEIPSAPAAAANAFGGFTPGRYGVAASYLSPTGEESALSPVTFVDLVDGNGLGLTLLPSPTETSLAVTRRIYRTEPNGDVLYRATDLPASMTSYILGVTALGRQAKTQYLERMIPGDFVRYWKGLLWTVRANVAYHSQPLSYGVYDPRFNFVQMQQPIRLFEPVEGGIFVGTKEGVYFIEGKGPKEFTVRKLGGQPPFKGSATRIPAALLGEGGDTGEYVVVWLSANGFVVGLNDGRIVEPQRKRIHLDDTSSNSAVVVHDRQVTAVVS